MTTRHACCLVLSLVAGVVGADWPGFRGPLDLGDSSDFIASPAISRGQLFVRSHEYLYAIGTAR